ncbi:DUF998 domain-containing protein [Methanolobus sp.]|jgi:hypothetical membrane protein|uniref:DUF998 domain-containing protein n=1 Tax=Methanolobus sp. TaxID=1874737 RepID=UPI0025D9D9FD|nr:DUF998 domain-containing protein [Methanolobus sp.]
MSEIQNHSFKYRNIAGALLFIAGVVIFLGITSAETFYPDYNTAQNMISDLGATEPPNSIITQPSATIFNSTMIVCGLCIILAAFCIHRSFSEITVTVPLLLFGFGALGVGIFPGNYGVVHGLSALLTFIFGGVAAIVSFKIVASPFRYLSVILGSIALLDLLLYYILGQTSPFAVFGIGGLERWIAYPVALWVTGFGGYLMGNSEEE